jgi:hypothetical protein
VTRDWCYGKEIIIRCCSCQKIRNEAGRWQELPGVSGQMPESVFSHGVCPACLVILYPDLASPAAATGKKKKGAANRRP